MGNDEFLKLPGHVTGTVSVLIETPDGQVIYKTWRGSNFSKIKTAARKRYAIEYPEATVSFGVHLTQNHYGAH